LNKTKTFFYLVTLLFTCRHGLEIMGQLSYRFYVAHLIPPEPAAVAQTRAALAQKKSPTFVEEIFVVKPKNIISTSTIDYDYIKPRSFPPQFFRNLFL
jgi:predicted membrane-bound dolichyl-phosphate-mannose-protein mannosyltransferase